MKEEIIRNVINEVSPNTVVAATKYVAPDVMRKLYGFGITDFGENRTDSFLEKYEALKDLNATWHFIGHLQCNKANGVVNLIDCLHSLDSLKLAQLIEEHRNRPLDVFIELKLVNNEAKSGVPEAELRSFIEELKAYPKVNVLGFMAMTDANMDNDAKRAVFKKAKDLATKYGYTKLSMGMSDDYKLALEEGATNVRLGRMLYEPEDFKEEYKHYIC